MATDTNPVQICSNALLMLGAQPIASFSEGEGSGSKIDRARLAGNLYGPTRLAMLRGHYWNCCARRVVLSPDATPPAFGFANRFMLPGDWLRTWAVGNERNGERINYRSEGRYLLADEIVLPLLYAADAPEQDWDTLLVQAMTLTMAARMAYAITASTTLAQMLQQELAQLLQQARAADGQDDPPETFGDAPLLSSRFTGRRG